MTMRCYILSPPTVFTGRVDQTTFAYPLAEVTFDGGTAIGTVQAGQTVLFGTSVGDDDLGRQRVRPGSTIGASGTLNIGRSSRGTRDGEVNLQDDAHITILEDYRVWAKIPRIVVDDDNVTTIYKDHDITVGDKTTDPPPVANTGIPMAGTIDSGTGLLRVELPGENSLAHLPTADGATISSYSWTLPTGVSLVTGYSATDAVIQVDCQPGFYWIALEVTDSNGNTHTSHVPVYARDPDDDTTLAFQIESHVALRNGQELTLRLLEDVDAGTYPDGTLVIVWEDEPAGPEDRDHIVFWGWHDSDPSQIASERTALLADTSITCVDVAGRLDRLPGFPQSIASASSPSAWTEMASPNMDKYLHYLLHWHSTALDLADFSWSGTGSDFPFVILGSDGESLYDQVERRARALVPDYHFTCNRKGQLQVLPDPLLQSTGNRTATVQKSLAESDWRSIRYTRQRTPRVHWLRENAILADANTISALFAVAPGESPGQGERAQEQGEQLAQSQSDLNAVAGNRYARLNAPQTPFSIELAGGDDFSIDPAEMTWVRLTMSAATAARRGLAFTNERGLPLEVSISYDYSREATVKSVELQWERETDGPAAVIDEQETDDLPDEEFEPPDGGYDEDPGGGGGGDGFGTVYAMTSTHLGRTRDLSAASPSWVDITGTMSGDTLVDFRLDPWAPTTIGFCVTEAGVYKSTDLDASSPTWTMVLSAADITTATGHTLVASGAGNIAGSINQEEYFAFVYANDDFDLYCAVTDDRGATWTHNIIDAAADYKTKRPYVGIVPHIVSGDLRLFVAHTKFQGGAPDLALWRSDDGGSTWARKDTVNFTNNSASIFTMDVPYEGNESGDIMFLTAGGGDVWKTTAGGDDFTSDDVYTDFGGEGAAAPMRWGGVGAHTQDSDRVFYWNTSDQMWISTTGGGAGTWTQATATGLSGTILAAGGFPYDSTQYYAMTTAGIFVSTDGGENWTDKTGDFTTAVDSTISGAGVVVPVWVAE